MINIQEILIASLQKRNIFHSEADFQHHLAWYIHTELKNIELRLEYPLSKSNSNRWEYCDIILKSPCNIGVELKYKTKAASTYVKDELFELKDQRAQDVGRYDFLKDVQRLENWCIENKIDFGYAIMLTNDSSYWSIPKNSNTVDKKFRLHSRKITGKLAWGKEASAGTMKNREKPIILLNEYELDWNDVYNSGFKYLFLQVKC